MLHQSCLLAYSYPTPIKLPVSEYCSYLPTAPGLHIKVRSHLFVAHVDLSHLAVIPSCTGAQDRYLPLSTAQQLKLKQLTLVTMAAASKVSLQLSPRGSGSIHLKGSELAQHTVKSTNDHLATNSAAADTEYHIHRAHCPAGNQQHTRTGRPDYH